MSKLTESQLAACREGVAWAFPQDVIHSLVEEIDELRAKVASARHAFAVEAEAAIDTAHELAADSDLQYGISDAIMTIRALLTPATPTRQDGGT